MQRRRAVPAAVLSVLALPVAALAATISVDDSTLHIASDADERASLRLQEQRSRITIDGSGMTAGTGCTFQDPDVVCPSEGIARVDVRFGDGADSVVLDNLPGRISGGGGRDGLDGGRDDDTIDGGPGNDRLNGSRGNDRLTGAAGADNLEDLGGRNRLSGGSGNDRIQGGIDADVLTGGSGNDRIATFAGRDRVNAGSGNDRVNALDNDADVINCGSGRRDVATIDTRGDRVRGCERVLRG